MNQPEKPATKPHVIVVGCGRVGARLAMQLDRTGYSVAVVDTAREAFIRLSPDFGGTTHHGDGLDGEVLERAGAAHAAFCVALTGGDNRNLMITQLVKHRFPVQRALARLHDPVRAARYRELGVETLCTTTVLEGLIEIFIEKGDFPELPGEMSVYGDASALKEDVWT